MVDFRRSSVGWSRFSRLLAGVVLVAALLFGINSGARAEILTFNMDFIDGGEGGSIGSGTFTIDGTMFTGTGAEQFNSFTSTASGIKHGLLSFNVDILGVSFAIEDDLTFPDFPKVDFQDGVVTKLNHAGSIFNGDLKLGIFGFGFRFDDIRVFDAILAAGSFTSLGSVVVTQVSAIPLPAALPLFLTGLAGLGYASRRRRLSRV